MSVPSSPPETKEKEKEEEVTGLDGGEDGDEEIVLLSKEQKAYKVSRKAALMSKLIKTTLEGDKDAKEVNLYHIEGPIVGKVIEWMSHHVKHPPPKIEKPLVSADLKECGVEPFDIKFVDTDQETMFKLLLAANYMDVTDLLFLVCAKVASLMKGKTPEQIRKTFNIRTDSTPEEEEEIRREHKDLIG